MLMGTDLVMTASGQYSQHKKQAGLPCFDGVHLFWSIKGKELRHSPVLPPSPIAGDDSSDMCPQALVPIALQY